MHQMFPVIVTILSLISIKTDLANTLAQPKSFTDDPFIDDEKFTEKVVKHEVVGVVGEGVAIPCNCTPSYSHTGDKPALILWYKDKAKLPIYSFDLRQEVRGEGQHWKDHKTLGDRGYVFYEESPHSCKTYLNIEPVVSDDSGQYRCRVDYEISPTRNTRIKLKLIARPTPPVIFSDDGHEILDRTKPVKLGSDLKLYCTSQGGDPAPSISWRRGGVPVPAHGQDVDNISGRVRSTVIISDLKASDQGAKVTCTADNSALIQPQTTSITLDVIVPPVRAKIVREWNYFTADTAYNVTCQVLGSRPSAVTHMWVGAKPLKSLSSKVGEDGNVYTSVMEFLPQKDDDQKFLSCQGKNELIDDIAVEDQWKITVYYKPEVWLSREGRDNNSAIKLGDDVALKCTIVANPGHHTIIWTKKGENLEEKPKANVHLLDETLFINSFSDEDNGEYSCVVTNQAGTTTSNGVQLYISAMPACTKNETQIVNLGPRADLNLDCRMKWASNDTNLRFRWTMMTSFNSTSVTLPPGNVVQYGNVSKLSLPASRLSGVDLADISCEASRDNSWSGHPCRYRINTQGVSNIALDCNIFNQTFSSFTVNCAADGTMNFIHSRISYQFEIKNIHTGIVIRNISTSTPRLTLEDLPSGSDFMVTIYSYNNGKKSKMNSLEAFTTRAGEKQLATMPEIEDKNPLRFIPMLAVFLLISLLLVLITITIVAIIRRKMTSTRNSPSQQLELLTGPGSGPSKHDTMDTMDYSPDIIPKEQVYGYCQSIEDLRHNKEMTVKDLMTSECLLDNSISQSGDRGAQTSSFKRPDSYYAELSFGKFTGDTFKIPNIEKTRHNTASSTSTEYAQILSVPHDPTAFEDNSVKNYSDLDKNDIQSQEQLISSDPDQNESISVFQSKVGNQNQVFPKYKPHNSKKQSQSLDSNFMEKQNSIERLNSSLSSDVTPCEYLGNFSQIYTISRLQNNPPMKSPAPTLKRVKFEDESTVSKCGKPENSQNLNQKCSKDEANPKTNSKLSLCSLHKQKLDKNISG